MSETNDRNGFAETIAADLAEGRLLELAELYALDALTAQEQLALEAHLKDAPEQLRSAFEFRVRQAREVLAISYVAEEEPPAGLFARIVDGLPVQEPAAAGPRDELAVRRAGPRRRMTPLRWLAAAAAAAVVAGGGIAVGSSIISAQDPVNQVLAAPDVSSKQTPVGGGTATLRISAAKDAAVVTMDGVAPPPAGKVYQMWLIPQDGKPVSAGTMDAAALSKNAAIKGVNGAKAFAITVEPAGGSAQPTLPPVATVPLQIS